MPSRRDDGFTLIELLVVILVIGILASVAIPTFLGQRQKGYDAQAKADLRNLANFEEIYFVDFQSYAPIASIQAAEPRLGVSPQVTISVVRFDATRGYCLASVHSGTGVAWYWDSQGGGLQRRGAVDCPVTTTGIAGDSITG